MANGALWRVAGLLCLGFLPGCAVVQSQAGVPESPGGKSPPVPNGIPYFLPRRSFVATVTEPFNGGPPTITVTNGIAEPDLSKGYVLSQGTNLVADNESNIGVSVNGLLKSSNSTATSQVAATVQNLGATIGTLTGPGSLLATAVVVQGVKARSLSASNIACPPAGGSYSIVIYPESKGSRTLCGEKPELGGPYKVSWLRADSLTGSTYFGGDSSSAGSTTPISGIFFRHELPYVVTIRGRQGLYRTRRDTVITSPDESETDFFPINRSFFANNAANITITDGVITGVDQTTKSEVAAAVGLPAAFVGSYTGAIGQVFSSLSTNSADQQKYMQQVLSTSATQNQASAVAVVQNQICAKTIASYDLAALGPADLAKAQTAIEAACPGK